MFYQPELDRGAAGGVGAMIDAQVSVYLYVVNVYDFFGVLETLFGLGSINKSFYPNIACFSTYYPPYMSKYILILSLNFFSHTFFKNHQADRLAQAEALRLQEMADDDFVAMPEPISVDTYIQKKIAAEDTGAGVFGALNYMDSTGECAGDV